MSESVAVDPPPSRPRLAASMARRRQSIIDSAVDLFRERGYLGTTVDDIAARAGVTKRTLYHHMGNKENILSEIHSAFIDEGLRRWEGIADTDTDTDSSASEVLGALIDEHVKILALHRDAIAVFFEEAKHLNVESRATIKVQRDRYEQIFEQAIARGVASGEFRADLNVRAASLLLLGGLTEMYHWYRPTTEPAQAATIALCTSLMLKGIGAAAAA